MEYRKIIFRNGLSLTNCIVHGSRIYPGHYRIYAIEAPTWNRFYPKKSILRMIGYSEPDTENTCPLCGRRCAP